MWLKKGSCIQSQASPNSSVIFLTHFVYWICYDIYIYIYIHIYIYIYIYIYMGNRFVVIIYGATFCFCRKPSCIPIRLTPIMYTFWTWFIIKPVSLSVCRGTPRADRTNDHKQDNTATMHGVKHWVGKHRPPCRVLSNTFWLVPDLLLAVGSWRS